MVELPSPKPSVSCNQFCDKFRKLQLKQKWAFNSFIWHATQDRNHGLTHTDMAVWNSRFLRKWCFVDSKLKCSVCQVKGIHHIALFVRLKSSYTDFIGFTLMIWHIKFSLIKANPFLPFLSAFLYRFWNSWVCHGDQNIVEKMTCWQWVTV